jgi:hypothetical protein
VSTLQIAKIPSIPKRVYPIIIRPNTAGVYPFASTIREDMPAKFEIIEKMRTKELPFNNAWMSLIAANTTHRSHPQETLVGVS